MNDKDTEIPGSTNDPVYWAFYLYPWGWAPPNRSQVEIWMAGFDTVEKTVRDITAMSFQRTPIESLHILRELLTILAIDPTDSRTCTTPIRILRLNVKRLLRRFDFLQDHLPNKEYTFEDLRNCIYSFPPSDRRNALDYILGMFDIGGYTGSLTPMQKDIVREWPDRLEENSRDELSSYLDTPPTRGVSPDNANQPPRKLVDIVRDELASFDDNMTDYSIAKAIAAKYPERDFNINSLRAAVRDERKRKK
jgi:hypothetical protein